MAPTIWRPIGRPSSLRPGRAVHLQRHPAGVQAALARGDQRFLDAVRFGDFSQGFSNRGQGSGFGDLSEVLDDSIKKLRDERHRLELIIDSVADPIIVTDPES